MKLLVVAPHLDDESLSCGALIHLRAKRGHTVRVITLFDRRYVPVAPGDFAREQVCFSQALHVLGYTEGRHYGFREGEPYRVGYYDLLEIIEQELEQFKPDEVVIPSSKDLNQDHRHLHDVCKIALRPANLGAIQRILVCRSFDTELCEACHYVVFDRAVLDVKLQAVLAYVREVRHGSHPRSAQNIEAMHRVWGSRCGAEYAEAYDILLQREQYENGYHGVVRVSRDESDRVVPDSGTEQRVGAVGSVPTVYPVGDEV